MGDMKKRQAVFEAIESEFGDEVSAAFSMLVQLDEIDQAEIRGVMKVMRREKKYQLHLVNSSDTSASSAHTAFADEESYLSAESRAYKQQLMSGGKVISLRRYRMELGMKDNCWMQSF